MASQEEKDQLTAIMKASGIYSNDFKMPKLGEEAVSLYQLGNTTKVKFEINKLDRVDDRVFTNYKLHWVVLESGTIVRFKVKDDGKIAMTGILMQRAGLTRVFRLSQHKKFREFKEDALQILKVHLNDRQG